MRHTWLATFLTAIVVVGCNDADTTRVNETQEKLAGTWLLESETGNVKSRRILTLDRDGKFSDRFTVTTSQGNLEKSEYGGDWSYDGGNLKRRFLQEGGRKYSGGKIRFATFPLISISAKELVVDDNIQRRKLSFSRVPEGSQP